MLRRMRTKVRLTKRFLHDRDGAVAVIVVLSMGVILGIAALAVDGGYVYWLKTKLQATADASALAGTGTLPRFRDSLNIKQRDDVVIAAQRFVESNMPFDQHGPVLNTEDVAFGHWDEEGIRFSGAARTHYPEADMEPGMNFNTVTVVTKRAESNTNPAELFFARVLGFTEIDVTASAVATEAPGQDDICILALHPTFAGSIEISGDNKLKLEDCGIALTSISSLAFKLPGSGLLAAKFICVADSDGVDEGGSVTLKPNGGIIRRLCIAPPDPFANLPEPTVGGCTGAAMPITLPTTLNKGTYCGGIEISGSNIAVKFNPGEYILRGGGLIVSGSGNTISGNGVMFFNTDDNGIYGNIEFPGDGNKIDLSAPVTGLYAGVLFYQDHDASPGDFEFKLNGNVTAVFDGLIYMPDQQVEFSGESKIDLPCGPKIIAYTIKFSGNNETFAGGAAGCASNLAPIPLDAIFRLVL